MRDLLDDQEFADFMFDYRCATVLAVYDRFEAVKDYIRFHCIVPGSIEEVVNEEDEGRN